MPEKPKKERSRQIKFLPERHIEIEALRDELAGERHNDNLSLPDTVSEAIKFYKQNRPKFPEAKK